MRKFLSLLLSAAMLVTLFSAVTLSASAADEPIEAVVTEMTVNGNTIFVYAPENDWIVESATTAPCFMVFGDEPYTTETAEAEALSSGLAKLAVQEGAVVVFINPQGETWGEADIDIYTSMIDMYTNSTDGTNFVNGITTSINFLSGQEETKIIGANEARIYLYAEGSGADFVAANYMKTVSQVTVFPDGFSMAFDRTPTSVTLFNPTVIPVAGEKVDLAVAIVNGPDDTTEKLANLTDKAVEGASATKDGFDAEWILDNYSRISGAYRRQVGILLPMIDYTAEGIVEKVETFTVTTTSDNNSAAYKGTDEHPVNVVTYYAEDLDVKNGNVPLVLCFHGGGNSALFEAMATEWPLIGKEHGFITVSVDLHYPNCTASEIVELIDQLKEEYSIDASRIYASGFSMGSVKSWDLFEQYPEVFAGLAPMDATEAPGTDSYGKVWDSYNTDVMVPIFFVGGQASPLAELPYQEAKVRDRVNYAFDVNDVIQDYAYNADVNYWWGVNGQVGYQVTDKAAFTDSTLNVNLFKSVDGRYYTALADASNQSHEVYARNSWAAWDFLSQFSRNEDGSISIAPVTYSLASDDGKITDNSYNTGVATKFIDVPYGEYYDAAVTWAAGKGVTGGTNTAGTLFDPSGNCTRAQIVTFLWRAYGEEEPATTENPFTDLDPNQYYYKAVLWAVEKGITDGYPDGTFNPNGTCTRAQAVTFLWRAANKPTVTNGSSFSDVPEGEWYTDAVVWAVANNITTGATSTTFNPGGNCTRAQIVTFLYRELGSKG